MNNLINKIKAYITGARLEIQKVAWPTQAQIISHTKLVIGISLAMAVFLGIIDYVLTVLIQRII